MKNNEVQIKGKILYKFITPNKNNVLLRIGCKNNVVSCFVCGEKLKEQISSFDVGDFINFSGNIQSSRRGDDVTCTVFVEEIIPPYYSDAGFYNKFWLDGTVAAIRQLNECIKIIIKTENEGRISYVPVVFYYPDIRKLNFEVGEKIATTGSVQSVRKKSADGEYVYYQNYLGNQDKTG
mgnify:CR=1 FL=1